jgi:hypothetical protein
MFFGVKKQIFLSPTNDHDHDYMICNSEWEQLNNQKLFFRKNIAYYYTDLNKIRLGLIRDANLNLKFKLLVIVNEKKYTLTDIKVIDFRNFHHDTKVKSNEIRVEYIEADFKIDKQLNKIENIKVKIIAQNNDETKNLISLTIKKYDSNLKSKKDSMICSNFYTHAPVGLIKSLEWWFEINKLLGYDKIVLFNHTFGSEFNSLFLKYNKLVQINQYQCVPNLFTQNHNLKYIKFKDINGIDLRFSSTRAYRNLLQMFLANECYLMFKDEYKYITVVDTDELIIPRQKYERELNESFYHTKTSINQNCTLYLENIAKNMNTNKAFSFTNANYLSHKTMNQFFNELEKIIKLSNNSLIYNHKILISKSSFFRNDTQIKIETRTDFEYAKFLFKMHKKYVEPFLIKNKESLDSILENYNRFYYLYNIYNVNLLMYYKTTHNTSHIDFISHHVPALNQNKNSVEIPLSLGHLSHFRQSYLDTPSIHTEYTIKQLYFDYNYFNNYFKPILVNRFNKKLI